jgi:O-succinylbenzoic acid--CoA ligase
VYDGEPLPGVGIATLPTGEVVISGPMLALGYRLDRVLTETRFTESGYRTGDLGSVDSGRLTLHGRIDDVVVVNGVNVALGAVEKVIDGCQGVEAAVALALPLGEAEVEIVALVIATSAGTGLREQINTAVQGALGRPAVPRRVAVVPDFPLLPNRKIDRVSLRALAAEPGRVTWLP